MAVAQALGEIGQCGGRLEAEGAAARADAHDQAIAACHRPQDARAPALHVGHGVHRPASAIRRLQLVIDGVAPGDPQAARQGIVQPRGDGGGGRRVLLQHGRAHGIVGDQRGVRRIEQMAGHARGRGEGVERIDRLGDLGDAAMAVAQHAGEPARIGQAAAHHAGDLLGDAPRLGLGGLARVEMVELGLVAEQRRGRGEAAGEIGDAVAVQKVALAVVLRMHQHVGRGDAIAEAFAGCTASTPP